MSRAHTLKAGPIELVAGTGEILEADMLGREPLSRRIEARLGDGWPPVGHERHVVEWASAYLREHPGSSGWLIWYMVLPESPDRGRTLVGSCGFKGKPRGEGLAEAAVSVLPAHRRRGYATEAVSALLDWAFVHRTVRTVAADASPDDAAMTGLLAKCGFKGAGPGEDPGSARYTIGRADHEAARLRRQFETKRPGR